MFGLPSFLWPLRRSLLSHSTVDKAAAPSAYGDLTGNITASALLSSSVSSSETLQFPTVFESATSSLPIMASISSNELFPPLDWSATAESSSYSQTVPVDVRQTESVCSSSAYAAYWHLVLDRTTLDAGFDVECLDGLDDTLLLSPDDAFAAVCWDTAIKSVEKQKPFHKSLPELRQKSGPRPLPPPPRTRTSQKSNALVPRRRPASLAIGPETSSEESEESGYESDSDELRTLKEEITPLPSPFQSPFPSPLPSPYDTDFHLNHQPTVEPISLIKYSCLPYEVDTSFVLFEPHHTISYHCEDGIGLSSFNVEHRKATKVNRIASFCANLPSRLLKASS